MDRYVAFLRGKREAEAKLGERLGYAVPVFLRSAEEVAAIAAQEPFDSRAVNRSQGKLQVSFLLKKPSAAASRSLPSSAADS